MYLYFSDDEDEDDDDLAVAATFGVANLFKTSPSSKTSPVKPSNSTKSASGQKVMGPSQQNVDKERLTVDISALRQQYRKLRQRQQQAHIILTRKSTFLRSLFIFFLPQFIILFYLIAGLQNGEHGKKLATGVSNASTAMNHLLLGKKPLVATKPRRGPHPGAIPSPKNKRTTKGDSSNNTTSTTHQIQRNSSATHYACPQVRTFNLLASIHEIT